MPEAHYVTLLKQAAPASAVDAVEALELPGERCSVRGRAAHVVLLKSFHENRLMNGKVFKELGVGTARNVTVIRELARRWVPAGGS